MRFSFVVMGMPHHGGSGGSVGWWAIMKYMAASGHQISACILLAEHDRQWFNIASCVKDLQGLGIHVETIMLEPQPQGRRHGIMDWLSSKWQPCFDDFYPEIKTAPQIEKFLRQTQPHAVCVFDTGVVAAAHNIRLAPRLGLIGDPLFLTWKYRLNFTPWRRKFTFSYFSQLLTYLGLRRTVPQWLKKIASGYEALGYYGAQHAQWGKAHGLPGIDLRTAIEDHAGIEWKKRRAAAQTQSKPKILMLGVLRGTASTMGLQAIINEILPRLEQNLGRDQFELHIAGRGPLLPHLEQKLKRPSVRLRGYVERADIEFLSCDVFTSPSAYPVGLRTRLVEAFSYGCAVAAHESARAGLPEIIHEHNALLSRNGKGLAKDILRLLKEPALRERLQNNARRTYEERYAPEVAAPAQIKKELERLCA